MLIFLLDAVLSAFKLYVQTEKHIMYLSGSKSKLRYKNLSDDPSPEDAKTAI